MQSDILTYITLFAIVEAKQSTYLICGTVL